jgi:hypothetical protein
MINDPYDVPSKFCTFCTKVPKYINALFVKRDIASVFRYEI